MKLYKFTGFSLLLFTFISLAFPNAASASKPDYLGAGESKTFPTWEGGKKTQLCILYRGGPRERIGSVKINAGGTQEIVSNGGGSSTCIQRKWGGIKIGVTSQSEGVIQVWTS
jgi:hypothetical protein